MTSFLLRKQHEFDEISVVLIKEIEEICVILFNIVKIYIAIISKIIYIVQTVSFAGLSQKPTLCLSNQITHAFSDLHD